MIGELCMSISDEIALLNACSNGRIRAVRRLLSSGVSANARDGNGLTCLHLAAKRNQASIAKMLLANGACPNAIGLDWAPLHWAAFMHHEAVSCVILEAGASVDIADRNGETPMSIASHHALSGVRMRRSDAGKYVDVVLLLAKFGANVDVIEDADLREMARAHQEVAQLRNVRASTAYVGGLGL